MTPKWTTDPVPDGTWCWVYAGPSVDWITKKTERPVFLAKRDIEYHSAGGWTNEDCWEDFDGEVQCWIPLEKPEPPATDTAPAQE